MGGARCPKLSLGVVDVRDVADLHVRAMTHPAAKGERFRAARPIRAITFSRESVSDVVSVMKTTIASRRPSKRALYRRRRMRRSRSRHQPRRVEE